MGQYLIDNNSISGYFSELFSEKSMSFMTSVIDDVPNVSIITEIEALSWINTDKEKEKIVEEFIRDANILNISSAIVSRCVAKKNEKNKNT